MIEFLIDEIGRQVWYNLKYDLYVDSENVWYPVSYPNEPTFYIRPHREDGPAVICPDGLKIYFIHGKKHHEDGPAVIYSDGSISWYFNGISYEFDDWCNKLNKSSEEINFFKLKWDVE